MNSFARQVIVNGKTAKNAVLVQPMEGSDAGADGAPGRLTHRRYRRFARGGAGFLWGEAVAVCEEGRASAHQLRIDRQNEAAFSDLMETASAASEGARPLFLLQLTHSGRFSKPDGTPHPLLGCHDPFLDKKYGVAQEYPLIVDEQLRRLPERFAEAARCAERAGFDGVDVKACHRYLLAELLSAKTRSGDYGGSFENRTRLLLESVRAVRQSVRSGFIVGCRLNLYDGIEYPYGFGTDRTDWKKMDLTEPMELITLLVGAGIDILNVTMGTPYYNPHVNRPFRVGPYVPSEEQMVGVQRLLDGARLVKQRFMNLPVVATGFSYLGANAAPVAEKMLRGGECDFAGFGRMAIAYPDFADDLVQTGKLEAKKCCVCCSKCSDMLRRGAPSGCVVRDSECYLPLYRENFGIEEATCAR